jgi:asparagine synthase (glutamine-hydrolysing)
VCGIAGTTSTDVRDVRSMVSSIRHRGPDDSGTYVDELVAFGSCRLKIIDLSDRGHQPMANEDQTVWVVYNGEISNFRELREALQARGHRFASDTDTEVVVHGYEEWGTDVARHLEGMWAFAVYDRERRQILLSRDRTGIKPLYYLRRGRQLTFASELKTFLFGDLRPALLAEAIAELLEFGFSPTRWTPFEGVEKLLGGESLLFSLVDGSSRIDRYWDRGPGTPSSLDERRLDALLLEATERNLISDVPIGCYISGGIDSSLVAILYSKLYNETLHTFTVGFGAGDDESESGEQIADYLGSDHHALAVDDARAARSFPEIVPSFDFGLTDPSLVPSVLMAAEAKKHVKVVLAGEGGDEVFGGYDYYRLFESLRATHVGVLARSTRTDRNGIAPGPRRFAGGRLMKTWEAAAARPRPALMALHIYGALPRTEAHRLVPSLDFERTAQRIEQSVDCAALARSSSQLLLIDQSLVLAENFNYKADKASSSAGLEERVPLQDRSLVEYANHLALADKISWGQGKLPLRRVLRRWIPELAERPKHGFNSPLDGWLRGEFAPRLDVALGRMVRRGYLARAGTAEIHDRARHGRANDGEARFLWNLLVVDALLEHFGYAAA